MGPFLKGLKLASAGHLFACGLPLDSRVALTTLITHFHFCYMGHMDLIDMLYKTIKPTCSPSYKKNMFSFLSYFVQAKEISDLECKTWYLAAVDMKGNLKFWQASFHHASGYEICTWHLEICSCSYCSLILHEIGINERDRAKHSF